MSNSHKRAPANVLTDEDCLGIHPDLISSWWVNTAPCTVNGERHIIRIGTPFAFRGEPKVMINHPNGVLKNFLAVSIENPEDEAPNYIHRWIELNRDVLLEHWDHEDPAENESKMIFSLKDLE